uniref:uncharacterized protein n=1 Tax=Semicossyphus pulcher TaxID=241346 RepID=UPI0037E76AD5
MKPNDPPIPKMKPRLTRSAVREMCWLTQDCLSLPGREFLDKYCHLSDPQTTLEETQQFLMKSVAGKTGDQKWTKALKTVLSNVPQDMNLHPISENVILSNSSDLTVLTVKNKITVAQNGATYAKRLRVMPTTDKEAVSPESAVDDVVIDQNGCQSNLNDHTPCPQSETKREVSDASIPAKNEPSECTQMQENRENRGLKSDQDSEEHSQKQEEPMHEEDGMIISIKKEEENIQKVLPKSKRRKRGRRRKARCKKVHKGTAATALKIVLKKNPVKEKQWVSQSSLSPPGGCLMDHGLQRPHASSEETPKLLPEVHQKKWTNTPTTDLHGLSEAATSTPPSKPEDEPTPNCAAKPVWSKNMDGKQPVVLKGLSGTHQEMRDDAEKSVQSETEVDRSGSADVTGQSERRAADFCPESVQTSGSGMDSHVSGDKTSSADGVTPHSSFTKSSPVSHPVITPQGEINPEDVSCSLSSEQSIESIRNKDEPADSCPALLAPQGPSPASQRQWQPAPKTLERTLKLVAINPSQLVKRPAGDQPVVVLNHPDADIPEVSRIMEVVNRYRGEVQKVVLSRRTVEALSAVNREVAEADARPHPAGLCKNSVQERFLLKLKLRRLSRKKYEVVGAVSPSRDTVTKFRCWFCGRVFACQETWMIHRQRHLMEWKRPNCENS